LNSPNNFLCANIIDPRVQAEANSVAQRALGNLRTLRSLGAERVLLKPYVEAVRKGRDEAVAVGVSQGYFDASVM
jgi:hypothetical protein